MKEINEDILRAQLRKGNDSAYREIFNEHYIRLVSISFRIVENIDDSRDCAQSVFVNLYQKRKEIKITHSIAAYLNRSVINASINHKKRLDNIHFIKDNNENSLLSVDHKDILEEAESEARIWQEINDLPDRCKLIFKMSRFEDLGNDEIAEQLNLSKRTIETQISKALKILRSKLLIFFLLQFFI